MILLQTSFWLAAHSQPWALCYRGFQPAFPTCAGKTAQNKKIIGQNFPNLPIHSLKGQTWVAIQCLRNLTQSVEANWRSTGPLNRSPPLFSFWPSNQ